MKGKEGKTEVGRRERKSREAGSILERGARGSSGILEGTAIVLPSAGRRGPCEDQRAAGGQHSNINTGGILKRLSQDVTAGTSPASPS